jgi:hypothetical protein
MSTPPEVHHDEFERTDALPRLDLNVLADATPINSDLLTRTDSWSFEALQDLHWPYQTDGSGVHAIPKIDTSKLQVVEDGIVELIAPADLGFSATAEMAEANARPEPAPADSADSLAVEQIAATLEQEIVLFAEEHTASTPLGSVEPQPAKENALNSLRDLAILLDTETPAMQVAHDPETQLDGAAGEIEAASDEAITWVEMPPQDYIPSIADGAQELQRLLDHGQPDSSAMARDLALKLVNGHGDDVAVDVACLELDSHSLVKALFPKSHNQQQAELLSARQTIEEMRESNELLQQAIATAQQRVEHLKAEVERHTEIANARDSQLATSIEELTSRRLAMRELERVIQSRDEPIAGLRAELEALRIELQTAKDERGIMALNLNKTRERAKLLRQQLLEKSMLLQSLHADPAERTQTLARSSGGGNNPASDLPDRVLVPIDHGGPMIQLDRLTMTIGRTPQTDICIHSTLISREHARLLISVDAVVVEDLNSTNGCFVNDRRIQKKMMREGDVLTLADMKYRLGQRNPHGMLSD